MSILKRGFKHNERPRNWTTTCSSLVSKDDKQTSKIEDFPAVLNDQKLFLWDHCIWEKVGKSVGSYHHNSLYLEPQYLISLLNVGAATKTRSFYLIDLLNQWNLKSLQYLWNYFLSALLLECNKNQLIFGLLLNLPDMYV